MEKPYIPQDLKWQAVSRKALQFKVRRLSNDYLPTWYFKTDLCFPQDVLRLNYVAALMSLTLLGEMIWKRSDFIRWVTTL